MLSAVMRHLHSPAWRAASARQKIKAYFEAIGLPGDLAEATIYERLETRFGEQFEKFGQALVATANSYDRSEIYRQKNGSLEFSLLVGSAGRGAVHRAVMRWTAELTKAPTRILDVGCDNGILTCFYGLLWPTATITAIDISHEGIARARELADKLGLTNVEFLVQSVEEFAISGVASRFSLILTTTVLHEAGYFASMESDRLFLDEAFLPERLHAKHPVFEMIAHLLVEGGSWVGAEALTAPHLMWRWIGALEETGLRLDKDASTRLKCDEELLTVLVAKRCSGDITTSSWATACWLRAKPTPFSQKTRLPVQLAGLEAQFFFDSISGKRRIATARRWNKDRPVTEREWERIEVWLSDSLAICYRIHANMGLETYTAPVEQLEMIRTNWETIVRQYVDSGCKYET